MKQVGSCVMHICKLLRNSKAHLMLIRKVLRIVFISSMISSPGMGLVLFVGSLVAQYKFNNNSFICLYLVHGIK
jgi:hypothetical protein